MFIAGRQRFDIEPVSRLAGECGGTDERQ